MAASKKGSPSNPFLKAAEKKLQQNQAIVDKDKAFVDAARKNAAAQNKFFNDNFVPLIDQLLALPQKGARKFTVDNCRMMNEDSSPSLTLKLNYAGGQVKQQTMRGGRINGPSMYDSVTLIVDRFDSETSFSIRVIRHDEAVVRGAGASHPSTTCHTVDDVMTILGDFVATVAPDRLAELGGPAVEPEPQPEDNHQASRELWGQVKDVLEDKPAAPKKPRGSKPQQRGRRY